MKNIGFRIKTRREQLNMSQDELAKRLGYKSRSSINKIEMGHQNLRQSKIKAIADVLETTPAYIMGWDGSDKPDNSRSTVLKINSLSNKTLDSAMREYNKQTGHLSDDEYRIIKLYRNLTPAQKISIREFCHAIIACRNRIKNFCWTWLVLFNRSKKAIKQFNCGVRVVRFTNEFQNF